MRSGAGRAARSESPSDRSPSRPPSRLEIPTTQNPRTDRAAIPPVLPCCEHIKREHHPILDGYVGSRFRPYFESFRMASKITAVKTASVLLVVALITIQAAAQTPRSRQAPTASTETYESVDIDPDGNLRILTSEQETLIVPKGGSSKAGESFGKQTAFENPVLSDDRRAVGAQAMFANCCTSYDIPLQLVIYSSGKTHRFEDGLAIFDWHFADGGRRVAFSHVDSALHLLGSLGTKRHRKRAARGHR